MRNKKRNNLDQAREKARAASENVKQAIGSSQTIKDLKESGKHLKESTMKDYQKVREQASKTMKQNLGKTIVASAVAGAIAGAALKGAAERARRRKRESEN